MVSSRTAASRITQAPLARSWNSPLLESEFDTRSAEGVALLIKDGAQERHYKLYKYPVYSHT